jgi:hypothetical protein
MDLQSDFAPSPPYILTFSSAAVCAQWWELVRTEYPESTRPGPQLFILKGDDEQNQIQNNPRFYHLRDKWFYTASDGISGAPIIPLQDYFGNPVSGGNGWGGVGMGGFGGSSHGSRSNTMIREEDEAPKPPPFDFSSLTSTLEKMSSMIASNSAQIQALSVAQSSGLQSMQAINESNSTQIKNLTDNQAKLQQLIDQNASHYIALSNSSFQNHDQVKKTMTHTAEQLATLSSNQTQLTKTCTTMMKSIESVSKNMSGLADGVRAVSERNERSERERVKEMEREISRRRPSDASTTSSTGTGLVSVSGNKFLPAPRKLNRKIRGVWYEYDSALLDTPPKSASSRVST